MSFSWFPQHCPLVNDCSANSSIWLALDLIKVRWGRTSVYSPLGKHAFSNQMIDAAGEPPLQCVGRRPGSCRRGHMRKSHLRWVSLGLDVVALRIFSAAAQERSFGAAAARENTLSPLAAATSPSSRHEAACCCSNATIAESPSYRQAGACSSTSRTCSTSSSRKYRTSSTALVRRGHRSRFKVSRNEIFVL